MYPNTFQNKIFDQILSKYLRRVDAVDEISKLLNVGRDAVYRRMRGDTILSPEELLQIATAHHLSLDALIHDQNDTVFCQYNAFQKRIATFREYLENVQRTIVEVHKLPDSHFYYASQDIPIFHFMYYPTLTAFKLYAWGLTTWGFEYLENRKFHSSLIPPSDLSLTEEIVKTYNQLPSSEIWSLSMVDNTLNQIEYISTIDRFEEPEDALMMCDQVKNLVQHMREMATEGHKFSPQGGVSGKSAVFNLYQNELVATNNMLLVKTPTGSMAITAFCDPNFLSTQDARLCEYTEEWLNNIISKSSSISKHSDRNRNHFFNRLERRIKSTRNRIETYLEDLE